MKLRNKYTGNIRDFESLNLIVRAEEPEDGFESWNDYRSLAEFNEEWEDYKTAEPLIKDEKIRKAVRAWAEINNFNKVKLLVSPEYGSQFEGGYGFGRITFSGRTLDLDYPKEYTIAELCGEEEE